MASIDVAESVTEEVRLMLNARALNDEAIVFFHRPVELEAAHLAFLVIDFNGFQPSSSAKFRIGALAV